MSARDVSTLELALALPGEQGAGARLDTTALGAAFGGAAKRLEQRLLAALAQRVCTGGGGGSVLQLALAFADASLPAERQGGGPALTYNALLRCCAALLPKADGSDSAHLCSADKAAEVLAAALDPTATGLVPAESLVAAALTAWHGPGVGRGFRFLAQSKALGKLPGKQAARVLLGGRQRASPDDLKLGLRGQLAVGAQAAHWEPYLDALIAGEDCRKDRRPRPQACAVANYPSEILTLTPALTLARRPAPSPTIPLRF